MSFRIKDHLRLSGVGAMPFSEADLRGAFHEIIQGGLHGLCFSPYFGDQKPGDPLHAEQIRERLAIIRPHTRWIRTFSCTQGNEQIPKIAKSMGLQTLVGGWLGKDNRTNEEEIENLIEVARAGDADVVAVGNEVMYRGDLAEKELIDFIERVREALPGIPVGYVDAYYEFTERPAIAAACSVILANCYPFWERCNIEYSLVYMKEMYRQALQAAQGKPVIITETGWPSAGSALDGAVPSVANALRFFIDVIKWTRQESIELFYFSSFDEGWKTGSEGDVGAFWGLWDTDGKLKY